MPFVIIVYVINGRAFLFGSERRYKMALGVGEKKKIAKSNPIIYKLESYTKQMGYMANGSMVADRVSASSANSEQACTYAGIKFKTVIFMALTLLGYFIYFSAHAIFKMSPDRFGALPQFILESSIHQIDITITELVIFIVAAVITAITPFIAAFFRKSIPVVGTLYAVCQGYFIGFLTGLLKLQYRFIPVMALMITLAIVVMMLVLFLSGKIEVTSKFKSGMYAFFGTAVICTIITTILYVLPFTKEMVQSYFSFLNSPAVSLIISLVFMAAAILFLLVDFATIKECVENGLPQKYEWMAAWGLAYTVIYIYTRVFGYLMRIFSYIAKNANNK